jgi:hypothetical protein
MVSILQRRLSLQMAKLEDLKIRAQSKQVDTRSLMHIENEIHLMRQIEMNNGNQAIFVETVDKIDQEIFDVYLMGLISKHCDKARLDKHIEHS